MKKNLSLYVCAIGALIGCAQIASASAIVTIQQVGSNVVATGIGTVDLTDLSPLTLGTVSAFVMPDDGSLLIGEGSSYDLYFDLNGPGGFGLGAQTDASSATGDYFGFGAYGPLTIVAVPDGYVSGTPLSGTATWDSTTLAGLGIIPGTYTWTWGNGADADSVTLFALAPASSPVPEPSAPALLVLGLIGVLFMSRKKIYSFRDSRFGF